MKKLEGLQRGGGRTKKKEREMDGEIKSFFQVWILAMTCLCYCYYVAARLPTGLLRLLSLLPVFYLFIILPLNISSSNLGGFTAFLLVWLANFKLVLFSFDQGPLSPPPPKLFHFISVACLPIKIKQEPLKATNSLAIKPSTKSTNGLPIPIPRPVLLAVKVVFVAILFHAYNYKQYMHKNVILVLYCCHVYLQLELVLAISAAPARAIFGFELEPQFDEPYLATSLQDFWGRRWNLMVTSILRPTVYTPIRRMCTHIIGPMWAPAPAVVAAFVVSGLMHEALYYYLTRAPPTWEVTSFFILHGICMVLEVRVKKVLTDRWGLHLHPVVSGPLVLVFVSVTSVWLFWPQLLRHKVDEKTIREFFYTVDFVKKKVGMQSFWFEMYDLNLNVM